ncbi:THO2 plays a role in transcriptional elongation [Recurvomyces mirabilis]|uniref:THO complex subunit 2 n=1 Tax=Recurvomyces mirabilis TaxID=574656 RepID=A0AAE0WKZ8_9PEZI|nr:THO2 plays a role in transcriptional elongation [Recurvomyces mirabilis]KAK5151024.1 THO2 plays a role in transcriptional elongation [Recurvomyces mirabilis]
MPPGSANKRKRPNDDAGRPSPHRPQDLSMAQRMGGPADNSPNAVPVAPRNGPAPTLAQPSTPQPAAEISRTNTPVPRNATPIPPPEEESRGPPAPYAYEYVTDEAVASWQESGKQMLLGRVGDVDEFIMSTLLQELLRASLDGRLDPSEAGMVVKQLVLEHQERLDGQDVLLNTIAMLEDADTKNPALLSLLAATGIDPDIVRQHLDIPLLTAVNLVRFSFERTRARKTTNLLYKQANFNLLREETEGYAKLLTEYFNIAEESNKTTDPDVAENAFHRIMALVGAFDLDVGRVLDITLDISANLLVKAYAFFIKFYRCSSWWPEGGNLDNVKWEDDGFDTFPAWALRGSGRLGPSEIEKSELAGMKHLRDEHFWQRVRESGLDAYFELGQKRIVDYGSIAEQLAEDLSTEIDGKGNNLMEAGRKRVNENRRYMRETKMLPPPGNPDAAQILGFKLRFYASPAREADDIMPDNLIHFSALLIKIGFISLRDLYPHLHPADDRMAEERDRLEKEKADKEAKERPGGGPNKLAMASALTDDSLPVSRSMRDKDRSGGATPKPGDKKDDSAADALPPPPNQKLGLLKALLALGAIPEALYILGRFPWLVDVDTSLPPYLLRIARHMLSLIAESVKPVSDRNGLGEAREQLSDTAAKSDGTMSFTPRPPKLPTKWLGLEEVLDKDGARYRYYYTEWADNMPVCQTMDDVFQLCNTFLGFLGVKIGRDTVIYSTLLRLARRSLTEDFSESNQSRWLELMRRLLIPALSLTKHNLSLTDEVYQLLMLFPVTTRYNLYAEWFTGRTSRVPDVKTAFDHNRAEVKDVLRRVSNENVKSQARALGKVSYSSPGVLMMFMINQLEQYSNMIPALVECTKYFPKLAYDVLTWCLINSLSGTGRNRIQEDGMLTSSWLQSLSLFVAALFSRYPSVSPSPVLQYLASELRNGDSTDLEMFEQVLGEMAGIRSDVEFNDAQVLAMAGGEHLQAHTMELLSDTRHTRKSQAKRLIRALTEPGLVGQMLVAIAQERQTYAHHESSANMPLKVLGNNLDKIQSVFAQYLDVLRTNLKPEEFDAAVPDVVSLIGDFGLQPAVAFMICRASITHRVLEHDEKKQQEMLELKKRRASQEKSQTNGDIEMVNSQADVESALVDEKPTVNGTASESAAVDVDENVTATSGVTTTQRSPWHSMLQPIIDDLPMVAQELQDRVSMPFFVTFWTLALTDVFVPNDAYRAAIKGIEEQVKELNRERATKGSFGRQVIDRQRAELSDKLKKLTSEPRARVALYQRTTNRLGLREKHHWFDRSRNKEDQIKRHDALLQECFLPRAMISSLDAQYSYTMLKSLHERGTPGFSTLVIFDQLFRKQTLAALIFQCTNLESQHLGRFLNELLKMLTGWHAKREDYDTRALGRHHKDKLPGFVIGPMDYSKQENWKFMDYELFRRQVYNWHINMSNALLACFESGEYMHIRNGIMVLKAVVGVFPQVTFLGNKLVSAVEKLSTEEERQDLKLMALSVLAPLRSRQKSWVMPQAFRLNENAKEEGSAGPEASELNAQAPEFKPKVNGDGGAGPEDGEVEDEKHAEKATAKQVPAAEKGDVQAKVQTAKPSPEPRAAPTPPPRQQPQASAAPSGPAMTRNLPASNESARPELSRQSSSQLPTRPPRPESRSDSRPAHEQKPLPPTPAARIDVRSSRRADDGYGRLDRPGEGRPGSRDHSPGRSRARTPPGMQRSHNRDERPREARDDSFSRRDGPAPPMHARAADTRDRHGERVNGSMGPPTAQAGPGPRSGHLNSVVSTPAASTPPRAPANNETMEQFRVNNERMRLIEQEEKGLARNPEPSRDQSHDRQRRDERDRRPQPPQQAEFARDQGRREQATELAPSGPKKGRLSRDSHQESSYGRLNQPAEPPSGPRPVNGQSGRGGRNFTAQPLQVDTRQNGSSASSPITSRPPESPAADRQLPRQPSHDRRSSGQFPNHQASAAPSAPASQAPTGEAGGVNPDRLRLINGGNESQAHASSSPISSAPPSGPRAAAGNRPPNGAPTGPSPVSAAPPSGPASERDRQVRGGQRGPISSINATLQGGGAAQQSPRGNGQDVSFRGASSRQGSIAVASSAGPPASFQATAPVQPPAEPSRRHEHPSRHDAGPASRPDSRAPEPRQDLFQSTRQADARDDSRSRRDEEDRGQRGSGQASRERVRPDDQPPRRPLPPQSMPEDRDKRNAGPPRDDRRPPRDERDRRSMPGPRGNDDARRDPQMPGPGSMGGPPSLGSNFPRRGGDFNHNHEPSRDGPDDGRRGAGSRNSGWPEEFNNRGPARREDDRRDMSGQQGGGPSGRGGMMQQELGGPQQHPDRKRRHDEQTGFDPKRRRSGR